MEAASFFLFFICSILCEAKKRLCPLPVSRAGVHTCLSVRPHAFYDLLQYYWYCVLPGQPRSRYFILLLLINLIFFYHFFVTNSPDVLKQPESVPLHSIRYKRKFNIQHKQTYKKNIEPSLKATHIYIHRKKYIFLIISNEAAHLEDYWRNIISKIGASKDRAQVSLWRIQWLCEVGVL